VDLIEVLGLGVVGLELVVAEGPGRGDASVVPELSEIFLTEAHQRRPVKLGVPADEVVGTGMKGFPPVVVPRFPDVVLPVGDDGLGVPVVLLPRNVPAPLDEEDLLARRREAIGQGPTAGARSDDDDVVVAVSAS
jgi:hypothetical protein